LMLAEQGFVVIYEHVSKLQLETVAGAHALHPANTECPQCKGTGRVPMHHGLRDKECPRCGGRGWVKSLGR
jgi:DnaJ-class molecular chaperone